jgi:CheY-like chemotaxis protein
LGQTVEINSVDGRGSCFSVNLPIALDAPVLASVEKPAPPTMAPLQGLTIVCIDNDPTILDGMSTLLGGWNCRVITAADQNQAAARLRDSNATPDVLLVDYHLDEGNGIAAIDALRATYGAHISAILITADRSPQVRYLAGADDISVLHKPLKPAALRALLSRWRFRQTTAAE